MYGAPQAAWPGGSELPGSLESAGKFSGSKIVDLPTVGRSALFSSVLAKLPTLLGVPVLRKSDRKAISNAQKAGGAGICG